MKVAAVGLECFADCSFLLFQALDSAFQAVEFFGAFALSTRRLQVRPGLLQDRLLVIQLLLEATGLRLGPRYFSGYGQHLILLGTHGVFQLLGLCPG